MKKIIGIVDRFEGSMAIIEISKTNIINLEIKRLPPGTKEGDIVIITGNSVTLDEDGTAARKREIDQLFSTLFEE